MPKYRSALIVGTGPGLSASLARLFAKNGLSVALAARQTDKLAALAKETGASVHSCNAADPKDVASLFEGLDTANRTPDVVVYNASSRVRGALVDLPPDDVKRAIEISAFGAFLVSQQAVKRMLPKGEGAVLLSGATAGVKGFALSATFAMGKFALRGLAQSMARELSPKGIHVAHFVIDGGIRSDARPVPDDKPDSLLDPDAIAETYWHVLHQHRSAWSWEVEVRPWVEKFSRAAPMTSSAAPSALMLLLSISMPFQAQAMDIKVEGEAVVMSGSVDGSECTALATILSQNKIKTVVLTNSGGGNARAGYCVGDLIRERGLSTVIRGRCASSCSRMWLGGVERTLEGPNSRVGLHGNYSTTGGMLPDAPYRLRTWIPQHAPNVDKALMEQWTILPSNNWMMYFYNDKAELCESRACTPVSGRNAHNAGLSTK